MKKILLGLLCVGCVCNISAGDQVLESLRCESIQKAAMKIRFGCDKPVNKHQCEKLKYYNHLWNKYCVHVPTRRKVHVPTRRKHNELLMDVSTFLSGFGLDYL